MKPHRYLTAVDALNVGILSGHVEKVTQTYIETVGPPCSIGDIFEVVIKNNKTILAKAITVEPTRNVLMPFGSTHSISPGANIKLIHAENSAAVGDEFIGRLVDGFGNPIDGGSDLDLSHDWPIDGSVPEPTHRKINAPAFRTGLKVFDGVLPISVGQRVGIFAAAGVGKTTLIEQLALQSDYDNCVVCFVGERGREIKKIWSSLNSAGKAINCTGVAATSDQSPLLKVRAVLQALCLAEYWRAKGKRVLLLLDSVTRLAMALREVGLASGEPPTQRAYTPNVFSILPKIVERCGAVESGGSITAFFTVLSETDDVDDPIVEVMKSLLDGHIVLSRKLADSGHFPAVDVIKSVSRESERIMGDAQAANVTALIRLMSTYEDSKIMIESGIYNKGSNEKIDQAIRSYEPIMQFLSQKSDRHVAIDEVLSQLAELGSV